MNALYSRIPQLASGSLSLDSLQANTGSLRTRLANLRGPRDFFDIHRISRPTGWGDAQSRVSFNFRYFSANYTFILAMLVVYALLTNLLLLFVLILAGGGLLAIQSLQGADLVLPGGLVVSQQSLYIALGVVCIPTLLLASPISTIFWLIGAAGVTVVGHAVLLEKPLESEFAETV